MNRLRQTVLCVVAGCLLLTAPSESRADSYSLDTSHCAVIFGISHFGYSYTYGRFNQAMGGFVWDNANPAASQFQLAVSTASIDSNDKKRDDHLRSADFFNANQFPQIVFQSTSVRPAQQNNPRGDMFDVGGNLTMHGMTKQITLPMKKLGEGPGPYGKYRCGFFCQTTLKRSEFGMTNMIPQVGDEVAVTISFEGLRQGAAGSGAAPAGSATSGSATSGSGSSTGAGSGSQPKPAGSGSAPQGSGSAGSSGSR